MGFRSFFANLAISGTPTVDHSDLAGVEWPGIRLGDQWWNVDDWYAGFDYVNRLAALYRARQMTADTVSQLPVTAWRGIERLPEQPPIIRRPNPDETRREFFEQTILELFDHGSAYWRLIYGSDPAHPIAAVVCQHDDVTVSWNATRSCRQYTWRSREMRLGVDIVDISMNRTASQLVGTGPMHSTRLRGIEAALRYAEQFFTDAARPDGILQSPLDLDAWEADQLREQFIAARIGPNRKRGPAVVSGGAEWQDTATNPSDADWVQTHMAGILDIANLTGVPPTLLGASMPGSTSSIVYQNLSDVYDGWWRQTLQPTYVARIETELSRLLPRGQHAQFNPDVLIRGDRGKRIKTAAEGIAAGIYTVDEARAMEGLPPIEGTTPVGTPAAAVPEPEAI
jgi:HK97 family phage portal protein